MAQIETVVTGSKIETHIRGRVFRFTSKLKKSEPKPASRERRRICVLSHHDGRMLERWGVSHPCHGGCSHHHQTREEVEKLVRDGVLRYLPASNRNVVAYTYGREWKPVLSEGYEVLQLV